MFRFVEQSCKLGSTITLRKKNRKDDETPVVEFKIEGVELGLEEISGLVNTHTDERPFSDVMFRSRSATSELRIFKPLQCNFDVLNCEASIRLTSVGDPLELPGTDIKSIKLAPAGAGAVQMDCTVWAQMKPRGIELIRAWAGGDVYFAVKAPDHQREKPEGLDFGDDQ